MKTTPIISPKCFKAGLLLTAFVLMFLSSTPKTVAQKPLSFTDVEKEFQFASPLPEHSRKTILKQFGSVQNYHDSILVRKNRKDKAFILYAKQVSPDSVERRVFHITDEEIIHKGMDAMRDSILKINNTEPKN